jgi:hypothetical protein
LHRPVPNDRLVLLRALRASRASEASDRRLRNDKCSPTARRPDRVPRTLVKVDVDDSSLGHPHARADTDTGVESNARLTGGTAAALLVLFGIEGYTVLSVRSLLSMHVFVGMLLVPPVLLKIGSTGWRFVRYYRGAPAYRRKGPPPAVLRLLGPAVVVLTVLLLASGIALVLGPHAWRDRLLFVHKASFVLWLGVMTIHVLGHLLETARLAPRDWVRRSRRDVAGAGARQWALVASLALGAVLGAALLPSANRYLNHLHGFPGGFH